MYALTGNSIILYDVSNPIEWQYLDIIDSIDSVNTFRVS